MNRLGAIFRPDEVILRTRARNWGGPPPFDPPTEPGITRLDGGWALVALPPDEGGEHVAYLLDPDQWRAAKAAADSLLGPEPN